MGLECVLLTVTRVALSWALHGSPPPSTLINLDTAISEAKDQRAFTGRSCTRQAPTCLMVVTIKIARPALGCGNAHPQTKRNDNGAFAVSRRVPG